MATTSSAGKHSIGVPSPSLMTNLRRELTRHAPFSQMSSADVDGFLGAVEQLYFAPDEVLLGPGSPGPPGLMFIRRGEVTARPVHSNDETDNFHLETGDLFPSAEDLKSGETENVYRAVGDVYIFLLPLAAVQALRAGSKVFANFLDKGSQTFAELSRHNTRTHFASQIIAEQPLETRLGELIRQPVLTCRPSASLREVLTLMHERRVGSTLVCSDAGQALGIFSRADILPKVVLGGPSLEEPIEHYMVQPVHTLTHEHTAADAAVLMGSKGIRHVPVTRDDVPVGMVSERDLFALQKLNIRHLGDVLRRATDTAALYAGAADIRRLARNLLAQGLSARPLTAMISGLNDALTERLLTLKAQEHRIDLARLCWLALGSEGRSEQTISTDQDNALILPDEVTPEQRAQILNFATEVNEVLDDCGYPLCKGGVMASNPACCLSLSQWRARFAQWIEHGAPQDLLNASIYFDFRPLAGDARLARTLREEVSRLAQGTPRFLKQLALNALGRRAPLNWHGGIATDSDGCVDLKLQGTGIYVDVARLYALASGVADSNTRQRLEHIGPKLGLAATEFQSWISGFEFLQMLRLQKQLRSDLPLEQANRVRVEDLNDIDRRVLKEALREARSMLSRMQLDYDR